MPFFKIFNGNVNVLIFLGALNQESSLSIYLFILAIRFFFAGKKLVYPLKY